MAFINAHGKHFRLAGTLAVAAVALTVTACGGGGGGAAAVAAGSAPGQWTQAEVSQFTAAAGAGGSAGQDACVLKYVKQDMSFKDAMATVSVDSASDTTMSPAQVKAALVSKYGPAQGNAIYTQYDLAGTEADSNCSGLATASATPAATSESSCTVDCTNPVASGESGWLAQVQGALQNVQQDLGDISADASGGSGDLTLDGAELDQDATAALDSNDDPPPADNADWTAAMNDYVTAGEDYSDENVNSQDDNPTQASQAITAGNSALASFNAANGGVLNGTIQSL
jgi:hypothetical protein